MRTIIIALVALATFIFSVYADEDAGYYTPTFTGQPAPLDWNPDRSPINPDLAYKVLSGLDYEQASQDFDLRLNGPYMVLVEGCGGYLQCGVIVDLTIGRPIVELPTTSGRYEFYSDCDLFMVHSTPHGGADNRIDFYRWQSGQLVPLQESAPDCTYTGSID